MACTIRPYVKGYKRKEKNMKPNQRKRAPFKATDNAVFETLASVILGYRVNTQTPKDNGTPKEIKKLLKNL